MPICALPLKSSSELCKKPPNFRRHSTQYIAILGKFAIAVDGLASGEVAGISGQGCSGRVIVRPFNGELIHASSRMKDSTRPSRRSFGHEVPKIEVPVLARSHRILSKIIRSYFRSEIRGLERLPTSQTLIITHHDGGMLPINGICFGVHWYDAFGF